MNARFLRSWAIFVLRHSRTPVWPYFCVMLTIVLALLEFTPYAHFHFLLIAGVLTVWAFERWAFADLFAAKDAELAEALRDHREGSSVTPPPN